MSPAAPLPAPARPAAHRWARWARGLGALLACAWFAACTSGGGDAAPAVRAPAITAFTATQASIPYGGSTTLTPVFANGTGSIDQGLGTVTSGVAVSTGALTATRTYTLTVSGSGTPATAQATVTVQPPPISVTVSSAGTDLLPRGTQQFTATVVNSTNQAVTWSVQEGSAGGTISAAGLYTAPSAVGSFHVVATSQADPTRSASAVVVVTTPFTLSVTPVAVEQGTPGTTRIQINRFAGFTGAVTLSGSGVPAGFAGFFETTSATGSAVGLSLEPGQAVAPGTYNLSITGTALGVSDNRTLPVTVTGAQGSFQLAYIDYYPSDIPGVNWLPNFYVLPSTQTGIQLRIQAVQDAAKSAAFTSSIALSVEPIGEGITAQLSAPSVAMGEKVSITVTIPRATTPGTYPIRVKGTANGLTRWLDTNLQVIAGYFYPKSLPRVSMARNSQGIEFPLDFVHRGQWFYAETVGAAPPTYFGSAQLLFGAAPAGVRPVMDTPYAPASGFATESLTLVNSGTSAPGLYTVPITARRIYPAPFSATVDVPYTLNLRITDPAGPPDLWIHGTQWAQTVIDRDLRLVEGKPAVLLVQVMADRTGIPSPPVKATFRNGGTTLGTLTLAGPATVPSVLQPGMFNLMYKAQVQAAWMAPGLTVDIAVDPAGTLAEVDRTNNLLTLTPSVGYGRVLNLQLVPVVQSGLVPRMPDATEVRNRLMDFWPLRDVQVSQRTTFVTDLQLPKAGDISKLMAMLQQLALLRQFDGSAAHYYGVFNATDTYGGNGGISCQGFPVGIGDDIPSLQPSGLSFVMQTLVHELGHGFNLRHAPGGVAGGPNLLYPWVGASIGTWGYQNRTDAIQNPLETCDIMSYAPSPLWTSDFSYGMAQAYFESIQNRDLAASTRGTAQDQLLFLGSISPAGEVTLEPVHRVVSEPLPAHGTAYRLDLDGDGGAAQVSFDPVQVECLPEGWRTFMFTVPAQGRLQKVRILQGGTEVLLREAARPDPFQAVIPQAEPVVQEEGPVLKVRWDPAVHPYLTVVHEGEARTTLALNRGSGSVDLPLEGLPPGGRFRVIRSDGLNTVERVIAR